MLATLQQVGEPNQSQFNAGYLTHLYCIRIPDVVFVYAPSANSISQQGTALGIQPGSVITEFLIKPKTAVFAESASETADGMAFGLTLSFPMKGPATGITNWIHQNPKRRYLILTRDTLGNCYMLGDYGNGAHVSWSRQVSSSSLHQLSFSLVNWHPAQFIPTVDLGLIFPHREFDYSFDLSFS